MGRKRTKQPPWAWRDVMEKQTSAQPPDGQTDPDGLPLPDDATWAKLRAEAMTRRPKVSDWADLAAGLRWAIGHPGAMAPRIALKAVIDFLNKQPCVHSYGAALPLIELAAGLADLSDGITVPALKPAKRNPDNRRKSRADALTMGLAARAAEELVKGGMSLKEACRAVATALRAGKVRGWKKVNAETVKNWRARIAEGDRGAPQEAIDHFKGDLPDTYGDTHKQRGESLLALFRARGWAMTA
jgi:hypothetical protein